MPGFRFMHAKLKNFLFIFKQPEQEALQVRLMGCEQRDQLLERRSSRRRKWPAAAAGLFAA